MKAHGRSPHSPLRPLADRVHPHRQRAHGADQLALRPARRRALHPALRRHRHRAVAARIRRRDRGRPRLARNRPRPEMPPVGADGALRGGGREAEAGGPALSRLRDGRRTRPPAQAPAGARQAADLRSRRAQAHRRRPRRARSAGAQAALALQARRHAWCAGTTPCGAPAISIAPRSPIRCWRAKTAAISTRCPRWSTTSTSASPMSSAATTTSPTPRCRSRSSRLWAPRRRLSATTTCSPTPAAKACRSAAARCRSARCASSGVEALAVAALAVLVGSAEAVRPVASLAELAEAFDLADISRGAARFDEAELRALSARVLHHLPFAAVRERLEALGSRRAARRAVLGGDARQSRPAGRSGGVVGRRPRRDRADRRGPRLPRRGGRLPAAGAVGRKDLGALDGDAQGAHRPQGPRPLPPAAAGADRPRIGAGTGRPAAADRPRQSVGSIIRTFRLTPSGPTDSVVWP